MTRARHLLPPVTFAEREAAAAAAQAMRQAISTPTLMGEPTTMHMSLSKPRRGEIWKTWPGLPGLTKVIGREGAQYMHDLLPGWTYTKQEILAELIPDLERLAEHGERPGKATR